MVKDFADFPPYIKALAKKIQAGIDKYRPDGIIFSYHGIPKSYEKKGDPYAERCRLTTDSLVNQLGLDEKKIPYFQSYQSQFGPNEWLKPATADLLPALPAKGIKKVLVAAPSFVSDCLETIDELGRENRVRKPRAWKKVVQKGILSQNSSTRGRPMVSCFSGAAGRQG